VNIIKSICDDIRIIKSKKAKLWNYFLNKQCITDMLLLCKMKNYNLKYYNIELVKNITGLESDNAKSSYSIDEFDEYENH
jgi:aldehyde:ferredoxin oxidoreductase